MGIEVLSSLADVTRDDQIFAPVNGTQRTLGPIDIPGEQRGPLASRRGLCVEDSCRAGRKHGNAEDAEEPCFLIFLLTVVVVTVLWVGMAEKRPSLKRAERRRRTCRLRFCQPAHRRCTHPRRRVVLSRPSGLSGAQYNILRILRGAGESGLACREIGGRLISRDPDITRLSTTESRGVDPRARKRKTGAS